MASFEFFIDWMYNIKWEILIFFHLKDTAAKCSVFSIFLLSYIKMRSKMYLLCEKSVWCVGWFNSKMKKKEMFILLSLAKWRPIFFSHDDRQFCLERSFLLLDIIAFQYSCFVGLHLHFVIKSMPNQFFKCFLECLENFVLIKRFCIWISYQSINKSVCWNYENIYITSKFIDKWKQAHKSSEWIVWVEFVVEKPENLKSIFWKIVIRHLFFFCRQRTRSYLHF